MNNATDKVNRLVLAIVAAAVNDAEEGISERSSRNTGEALLERLRLSQYRSYPRHGDKFEARRIYTAARFLYKTEVKSYEQ